MYLHYFGLPEYPFELTPNTQFLFLSKQYEESLECLLYAIRERKGFATLIGEIGTGKTTLCRELLSRLDDTVATSLLFNPLLDTKNLIKSINRDFGCNTNRDDDLNDHIHELNNFLLLLNQNGKNAVVVIDEAQNLSRESLEVIRMLSNLETENQKLLQIILVGQPELDERLHSYELRQLNQRITIRCEFRELNLPETKDYILHRLSKANLKPGSLFFNQSAIKAIYKFSNGVPRLINMLGDRALLTAYVKSERVINKQIVKTALADLRFRKQRNRFFNLFIKKS